MEDKTKIYVVTHGNFIIPKVPGNYSLFVGANGKDDINADYRDDSGDNISYLNPHYCELTGLYWMWKNSSDDILGLCHYRRFLSLNYFSDDPKYFLTAKKAEEILEDYDLITAERYTFYMRVFDKSIDHPNHDDVYLLRDVVKDIYPDYLEDYDWFFWDNNKIAWYNMMICKKELLDSYCEWLFAILSEFDKRHDISVETGYRVRLQGCLSERLLNVWIHHNISPNKVKYLRYVKTDEKSHEIIKHLGFAVKDLIWPFYRLFHKRVVEENKK